MLGGVGILVTTLLATGPNSPSPSSSKQTAADVNFHEWCRSVGIELPLAQLQTTSRSVAGRGIFATQDIQQGDITISIPEELVFHEYNAASAFPRRASKLLKQKSRYQDLAEGPRKWWHQFSLPRRQLARRVYEFIDSSDLWQATLTSFCLEALETGHPWSGWISQWQRSDPMQILLDRGITWRDEDQVLDCVEELSRMLPDVSKTKLRVAVEMRLGRYEDLSNVFGFDDRKASSMFGILTSRAIELGEDVLGVLPAFDMINHSDKPNIGMEYGNGKFHLWALKDIQADEELFVCYTSKTAATSTWQEEDAVWMLVQWGIPLHRPQVGAELHSSKLIPSGSRD